MFKQILERKYFNKRSYNFYYDIPKSIECNSDKSISNTKSCSDFTIETVENKYMLCGFIDGNIIIYDTEAFLYNTPAKVISLYEGSHHKNSQLIKCVQWYPVDSGLFFTCSNDKKVKIWDTNKFKCIEEISLSHYTNWIAMSPCAKSINLVAVACDNNRVVLADLVSGSSTHILTNHFNESFQTIQWSNREENVLVTGDQAGRVSIWDIRSTRKALFHLDKNPNKKPDPIKSSGSLAHTGSIYGMEFSPDGFWLATIGNDGRLCIWDIYPNKANLLDLDFELGSQSQKVSRPMRFCWSGFSNYKKIWIPINLDLVCLNTNDGSTHKFQSLHFDKITSCLWNPGSHQFYTAGLDLNILYWNSFL